MTDRPSAPDNAVATGIDLFNQREFHQAHEHWEMVWQRSEGDHRTSLQGLIQVAAACWHLQRRRWRPALALLDRARPKLSTSGVTRVGIDAARLSRDLARLRATAEHRARRHDRSQWHDDELPRLERL